MEKKSLLSLISRGVKKSTSKNSLDEVTQFQERLAAEGLDILDVKLPSKIKQLDELCQDELFQRGNVDAVREITRSAIDDYLEETLALEDDDQEKNPLLKLLLGGGAGTTDDDASKDEEVRDRRIPKKLLLDKINLSKSNRINLKLSLELDVPKEKSSEKRKNRTESASSNEETEEVNSPPVKKSKTQISQEANKDKDQNGDLIDFVVDSETELESDLPSAFDLMNNDEDEKEGKQEEKTDEKKDEESDEKNDKDEKTPPPMVKSHRHILAMIQKIKPEIDEITDYCMVLRTWILQCVSRNQNMGGADLTSEIQAEMIAEIKGVEDEFLANKEIIAAYFVTRGGILSKAIKEPELEDFKMFLIEEDEKMFGSLRQLAFTLRNNTVSLFDALIKDQGKIFPTGQGNSASYSMY